MQNNKEARRSNQGQFAWLYKALCQERNLKPLSAVQTYLQVDCLRFRTDRVSLDHWSPILRSIAENRSLSKIYIYSRSRCKKVREKVDTEEKLDKLWRCKGQDPLWPILYTNFLLRCFVDSVAVFVRESSTLTALTLDGIPLRPKYLNILCAGLKGNATVTKLSLSGCRIGDNGCDLLLTCLTNNPKVGVLNLTACQLTNRSGRCLSLFLKRRKADLLQNIWEQSSQSAREENSGEKTLGLHTLILNQNSKLGDNGVQQLCYALKSDVWLKSLSLRRCGLSKYGAEIMIQILHLNNVIRMLDLTENQIPINTLQKVLKIMKRRRETTGSNVTLKKRLPLGWRRNPFKHLRKSVNGRRSLKRKEGHNRYLSKNSQWKRIRKFKKRGKQIKDAQEVKEGICRRKKLSDLETQLLNLMESNFKLKEELLGNKTLLIEQAEQRIKMENELQKMSVRLNDIKSKVVLLNCLSSKASSESQLINGLKYIFDKLELYSMIKQNMIKEEIILNNVKPLWTPPLAHQSGHSFMSCLHRRPYCPPIKI